MCRWSAVERRRRQWRVTCSGEPRRPRSARGAGETPRDAPAGRLGARNGGLTTLLFALPMLLVFRRSRGTRWSGWSIMSFQHTNLFAPPTWVGLDNFRDVINDPLFLTAVKNTAYFALLALLFGYPIPLVTAVLMSEVTPLPRAVQRPRVSPRCASRPSSPCCSGSRVLRRRPRGPLQHDARLGAPRTRTGWLSSEHWRCRRSSSRRRGRTPGTTVIIYLAALLAVNPDLYEAASVDGAALWRKVWHVTLPQLPRRAAHHADAADHRDGPGLLEPFLFTSGGPANSTLTVFCS